MNAQEAATAEAAQMRELRGQRQAVRVGGDREEVDAGRLHEVPGVGQGLISAAEADELRQHEEIIESGLRTFVEVGRALMAVRDRRLYRATHGTFEAYCEQRWQISRPRAYELISAATVVSAIADTNAQPPSNEAQARELARVPEPERAEVWRETVERTEGKPTAAAVRAIREERVPSPPVSPQSTVVLDDYVNAGRDVQVARYRQEFARALAKADDLLTFPAEEVAERCDPQLIDSVQRLHRQLGDYLDRLNHARSGLRVIEGGSR